MDQYKDHLKDISEIRQMMEKSTKFLSLSGLSGISAGLVAIAGAIAAWLYIGSFQRDYNSAPDSELITFFFIDAGLVFILALGTALFFSSRMARKRQLPLWNKMAKKISIEMMIPLAAGGVLILIMVSRGLYIYVSASTLIFYGLALLNASKYTFKEIRTLGISEVVLGLLCAGFPGFGLIFWTFGFGILHIVYGILMYNRYEKAQ